jgi:hypothetical protein
VPPDYVRDQGFAGERAALEVGAIGGPLLHWVTGRGANVVVEVLSGLKVSISGFGPRCCRTNGGR